MDNHNAWDDGFIKLGIAYTEQFLNNGDDFLVELANIESVLGSMLQVYSVLLKEKSIVPIENLPIEDKQRLFNEAKRLSKNLKEKHIKKVCRALHCFGTIVNI